MSAVATMGLRRNIPRFQAIIHDAIIHRNVPTLITAIQNHIASGLIIFSESWCIPDAYLFKITLILRRDIVLEVTILFITMSDKLAIYVWYCLGCSEYFRSRETGLHFCRSHEFSGHGTQNYNIFGTIKKHEFLSLMNLNSENKSTEDTKTRCSSHSLLILS